MIFLLLVAFSVPLAIFTNYKSFKDPAWDLVIVVYEFVLGALFIGIGHVLWLGCLYMLISVVPFIRAWYERDKEVHDGHLSAKGPGDDAPPPTDIVDR